MRRHAADIVLSLSDIGEPPRADGVQRTNILHMKQRELAEKIS